MPMIIAALVLSAVQAAATPVPMPTPPAIAIEQENEPRLATSLQLIRDHQPQAALDVLTAAIASYETARAGEKRRTYCGMSMTESILYMGMAAKDKVDAITVAPGYCTALYLKGYALIDLGRLDEAKAMYERVLTLAPEHAQFVTERGQLARLQKDWPTMLSLCERSRGLAALSNPGERVKAEAAALRCQGFALVEQHKLDEAEHRYRAALKLNPADSISQDELRFIAEAKAKK